LDGEDDKRRDVASENRSILKTIWYRKHRWLRHDNLLHDIIEGKTMGKATCGRKMEDVTHDTMEGRDYGQLKELISDRQQVRMYVGNLLVTAED